MGEKIAVLSEGQVVVHAVNASGNYGTLCLLSIDDDEDVGRKVGLLIGAKIDCCDCIKIICAAKTYGKRDFVSPQAEGK